MNLDTEQVISEVRQRPPLWDLSCDLHKDRDAKAKCWIDVCAALFPDYEDKEENKKEEIRK